MLKANTHVSYWTHLVHPEAIKLPNHTKVAVTSYPKGLFLTVEKEGEGWSLTGRSIHKKNSVLAKSLHSHLTKEGSDVTAFTVVLSHQLLPETTGRGLLIDAIDRDFELDWSLFHTSVLDVIGDSTGWNLPKWTSIDTLQELRDFYEAQEDVDGSSGVLIRSTHGEQEFWYRRPLEYRMVATFTNFDRAGNLYCSWLDDVTGIRYTGFFRVGEKDVINKLLAEIGDPVGRHVKLNVKSMTQLDQSRVNMYVIRYEGLSDELPARDDQFKLI